MFNIFKPRKHIKANVFVDPRRVCFTKSKPNRTNHKSIVKVIALSTIKHFMTSLRIGNINKLFPPNSNGPKSALWTMQFPIKWAWHPNLLSLNGQNTFAVMIIDFYIQIKTVLISKRCLPGISGVNGYKSYRLSVWRWKKLFVSTNPTDPIFVCQL